MRADNKAADSCADNNIWYETFADITFDTHFAPLSQAQGRAFISHYRQRYCAGKAPSDDDIQALYTLQVTIDTLMTHLDSRNAFVRLNTRSPKDAIALDRDIFQDQTQLFTLNEKLLLFFDLTMNSLRVHSGQEGVDLLLSSERIFVDIIQAFDAAGVEITAPSATDKQPSASAGVTEIDPLTARSTGTLTTAPHCRHPWDLAICVRQWENNLREDLEFRGFVSNYELIGVSQYNTYVSYPNVLAHKELIQIKLRKFFTSEVKSRLQVLSAPDTVIDFALLPEPTLPADSSKHRHSSHPCSPRLPFTSQALGAARVVVVELNPYNRRTGAGLFTWQGETQLDASCVSPLPSAMTGGETEDEAEEGGGGDGAVFDFRLVPAAPIGVARDVAPAVDKTIIGSVNQTSRVLESQPPARECDEQLQMMLEMLLTEADATYQRQRRAAQHKEEKENEKAQQQQQQHIIRGGEEGGGGGGSVEARKCVVS